MTNEVDESGRGSGFAMNPEIADAVSRLQAAGRWNEVRGLMERYDADGDGQYSVDEVLALVCDLDQTQREARTMKKVLGLALLAIALLFGVSFATSVAAVNLSKDTAVASNPLTSSRLLTTKTGEPLATNVAEATLTIAALPFLPRSVVRDVKTVSFRSEDDEWTHDRAVAAVDVKKGKALKITTDLGETVEWSEGSPTIRFTMADGKTFSKSTFCAKCTALNVADTDEVRAGLAEFERATGLQDGRHLSQCYDRPRWRSSTNKTCTMLTVPDDCDLVNPANDIDGYHACPATCGTCNCLD